MDVAPVVDLGRYPAKAVVGEPFEVTALVFREGHDALSADVVLTDPDGERRPWVRMTKDPETPDLWRAEVSADREGAWTFSVEGWSDPIATWRHNAEIKIPAEIDVELMFTEGRLLLERVLKLSTRVIVPVQPSLFDMLAQSRKPLVASQTFAPPPAATAYLSRRRRPGTVLRVS